MPVRLHVNVDHVAAVRNARGTPYPDPVFAAQICEQAGADGIRTHLHEDRRHIRDEDVARLRATLRTTLTLELCPTVGLFSVVETTRPDAIHLLPEERAGGRLDLEARAVGEAIAMAREMRIRASVLVDPDPALVVRAKELGAEQVELHTGEYGLHPNRKQLDRLRAAAACAVEQGLEVAVGQGLTRHNLMAVVAIEGVSEVHIGHALVSDAIFVGLSSSVRDHRDAIDRGLRLRG